MEFDEYGLGQCWFCKNWKTSTAIMNIYGEGCGVCVVDGNRVRFHSHKCPFCVPEKNND